MDYASIVTAAAGAICGLIASWYWYKSSNVSFWPDWDFEPVVDELANMGRFSAVMKGVEVSSKLNGLAASWTAVSVIFCAMSAIASAWK